VTRDGSSAISSYASRSAAVGGPHPVDASTGEADLAPVRPQLGRAPVRMRRASPSSSNRTASTAALTTRSGVRDSSAKTNGTVTPWSRCPRDRPELSAGRQGPAHTRQADGAALALRKVCPRRVIAHTQSAGRESPAAEPVVAYRSRYVRPDSAVAGSEDPATAPTNQPIAGARGGVTSCAHSAHATHAPMAAAAAAASPAFSGLSATKASVVKRSAAMEAAFCRAERVTLAGSMIRP